MVRAKWIPRAAAIAFFFLIFLQVPFFRVPCRSGVCTTPIHVAVGQLAVNEAVPPPVIKSILYPGAALRHLYNGDSLGPVWNNLLQEYNLTKFEPPSAAYKFRLEVVAGSLFAVAGAVVSLIKPGRMGMFGLLLITWGLLKDGILGKPEHTREEEDPAKLVHVDITLFLALALALLSVRYDMQKVQRLGTPIGRPLRSSTKGKLKTR